MDRAWWADPWVTKLDMTSIDLAHKSSSGLGGTCPMN